MLKFSGLGATPHAFVHIRTSIKESSPPTVLRGIADFSVGFDRNDLHGDEV